MFRSKSESVDADMIWYSGVHESGWRRCSTYGQWTHKASRLSCLPIL